MRIMTQCFEPPISNLHPPPFPTLTLSSCLYFFSFSTLFPHILHAQRNMVMSWIAIDRSCCGELVPPFGHERKSPIYINVSFKELFSDDCLAAQWNEACSKGIIVEMTRSMISICLCLQCVASTHPCALFPNSNP